MDRDIAIRLDALLMGCRGQMDMAAAYMKANLTKKEFEKYVQHIGKGMAELIDISSDLHEKFPDIVPKELK